MCGSCEHDLEREFMTAKRYVLVGTGARGLAMYARPLLADFPDTAALVGLCDHNGLRLEAANQMLGTDLPQFADVREALAALDPDGIRKLRLPG